MNIMNCLKEFVQLAGVIELKPVITRWTKVYTG